MHIIIIEECEPARAAIRGYIQRLRPSWQVDDASEAGMVHGYDVVIGLSAAGLSYGNSIDGYGLSGRALLRAIDAQTIQKNVTYPFAAGYLFERLSLREHDVLALLRQGASNKDIGHALGLQVTTIKLHVRGICRKLGVKNRMQAALLAQRFSTH